MECTGMLCSHSAIIIPVPTSIIVLGVMFKLSEFRILLAVLPFWYQRQNTEDQPDLIIQTYTDIEVASPNRWTASVSVQQSISVSKPLKETRTRMKWKGRIL